MPSEQIMEAAKALVLAQARPTPNGIGIAQAKATLALAEETAESNRLTRLSVKAAIESQFVSFASLLVQSGDPEAASSVESVKKYFVKEWNLEQAVDDVDRQGQRQDLNEEQQPDGAPKTT